MEEKSPAHYQYKGRFIMTAVKSGLMIIDQYRAHVRILYEKYMTQMTNRNGSTQKTLFPELVSFSPSECVSLQAIMPELALLGFDLQSLGGGSYSLNGVPADLEGIDMVRLLHDMVTDATQTGISAHEKINSVLALQMARSAAIPYGQVLSNAEMESLVNELFTCQDVNHTPDGKTILSILKQTDIEALF